MPGRHTILIVEDEPLLRFDLAHELRMHGFDVVEAARAAEAIAVLEARDLPVALLCTDVQMPGEMDGLDLVRWTLDHRPDVIAAVTSGSAAAIASALTLCRSGLVFPKPAHAADLARAFQRVLGEASPSSDSSVA